MRSWTAYVGDRATPEALIEVINRKKLKAATKLRDEVMKEFDLKI